MRKLNYILGLLLIGSMMTACGSKGGSGSGGGTGSGGGGGGGGYPPITEPTNPPTNGGSTVDLTLTSTVALSEYTGWDVNAPSDLKVTVNLKKYGTYTRTGGGYDFGYGGYVTINFKDSGVAYKDSFDSLVNSSGVVKNNAENHKYNLYTVDYPEMNGRPGYHGFFEDRFGAIIIVIDDLNDLGDGQGPTSGSGSVWFKNFGLSYAPLSPTSCWFVSTGPYDCRTWKHNDRVETKRSLYPESQYTKLGTFQDLDLTKAFNGEL